MRARCDSFVSRRLFIPEINDSSEPTTLTPRTASRPYSQGEPSENLTRLDAASANEIRVTMCTQRCCEPRYHSNSASLGGETMSGVGAAGGAASALAARGSAVRGSKLATSKSGRRIMTFSRIFCT